MDVSRHYSNHLDNLDWVEVPMWKAIKLWGHNHRHIKCVVGNHKYFYSGHSSLPRIEHEQVTKGIWYVEKM